ncbi:putative Prolamin-like domain-containing protein [Medicago truncatula]|uniref:Putative Prolamin-like domain-containing protein n=1 Tax=Medicago truncatula TaxID=3880 RepID=A0A396GMR0_MEDTR|nr:putative Prolamin-like domain-containing protein [Medicago truncatula]
MFSIGSSHIEHHLLQSSEKSGVVASSYTYSFQFSTTFDHESGAPFEPPSGGPSNDVASAPKPLSPYEKYLTNCASKLKPAECGKQIFSGVFVGNQIISDYCCHSLVNDVGKSCHYDLTRNALQWPAYAKNKTEILKRNDKVWNDCIAVRPILP